MPRKYLRNDATIRSLEAPAGERVIWWDDRLAGYGVRVSGDTGGRAFILKYRLDGQQRKTTLGAFPAMNATGARKAARKTLDAVARGEDPQEHHRKRRSLSEGASPTFRNLAEAVIDGRHTRGKTQALRRTILDRHLLPAWGQREPNAIKEADVQELVDRVATTAPIMANRTLATVKTIMGDPKARAFGVTDNPAAGLKPTREPRRQTYLEKDEVARLWQVLANEPPVMAALFKVSLLSGGQRIGTCRHARWDQITLEDDGGVWRIPASLFKGGRMHVVPLSSATVEVLEAVREWGQGSVWVFPSGRARSRRCDWCEREHLKCEHLVNHTKALARIRDECGLAKHWTAHDFRRTYSRWSQLPETPLVKGYPVGLGIPVDVVEAVVGHRTAGLLRDRYTDSLTEELYLLPERAAALEKWGAWVGDIVGDICPDGRP